MPLAKVVNSFGVLSGPCYEWTGEGFSCDWWILEGFFVQGVGLEDCVLHWASLCLSWNIRPRHK